VVVQVALAVILITGSGLMLRSFAAVRGVDLGFDADHTLVVTIQPSEAYYGLDEVQTFVDESVERMAAVPGVAAASASLFIPLNHETASTRFATAESRGDAQADWPTAIVNYPHANYFETMGIPLLAGRDFQRGDTHDAAPVVIVSQPLAERYWPGRGAVGETLLLGDPADPVEASVVGVVGPVLHTGLDGDRTRPQLYRPATQVRARRHFLLARVDGDPSAVAPELRRAVQSADPDLPFTLGTMAALVDENALQWSMGTAFLAVFGAGALLLAALGIYGLIAFSVAQRRRELGVRIALGASKRQVRTAVVGEGLRLTGFGLLLGAAATAGLVPLAASALFGVGPFDPLTFGGVLALFLAVAVLASWVPAARACRTDPATVLRAE
jgi:predicted permease